MRSQTPKLRWLVAILTIAIGLICGFMVGLILTEERFDVMMRDWVYVVGMVLAIILPVFFLVLGSLLPLWMKGNLSAVWWLGHGRIRLKGGSKKHEKCKNKQARAFVVFATPLDNLRPEMVETAIRRQRKRLWRGTLWAILSLVVPVYFLVYMATTVTYAMQWPVLILPLLYLLSLLTLIAAGHAERDGVSGALRQAKQLEQNRLWALTQLWADQRLHYPDKDMSWLNHVCLSQLVECDLEDALNLRAADILLTDLLAFHRNKPCPAPLMRVVRHVAADPEKAFTVGGEAVIPLLYHVIHGYATGENTRKIAMQLFDAAVDLTYDTDVGRYNIMQTEHIMREANHAAELADEKIIAPFIGYAYYTCFPQFYIVQRELNRKVSGRLRRRRKKNSAEFVGRDDVVAPSEQTAESFEAEANVESPQSDDIRQELDNAEPEQSAESEIVDASKSEQLEGASVDNDETIDWAAIDADNEAEETDE
ncbi:MAG: hypothetical protein FWE06_08025 [Oscillospiraceae bacterium]|nr:hypothetical protein [Oscillospiraceae bacterium]